MKDYRGFTAVETLLILVIVGLLGGTSWYVLDAKQKADTSLTNANKSNSAIVSFSKKTNSSPKASKSTEEAFLKVPELGVKFKLSENIKDAYYNTSAKHPNLVFLRVHSLDSEPDCKNSESSLADLIKTDKNSTINGTEKTTDAYKGFTNGNDFYYIGVAQYQCAQNRANQSLFEKVRSAFSAASSTITKL